MFGIAKVGDLQGSESTLKYGVNSPNHVHRHLTLSFLFCGARCNLSDIDWKHTSVVCHKTKLVNSLLNEEPNVPLSVS